MQKRELSEEINRMIKEHKSIREQVENKTWEDIEGIKEKNKDELSREIEKGMKQKSDYKLIKNEHIYK